jgi:hypothetical protein
LAVNNKTRPTKCRSEFFNFENNNLNQIMLNNCTNHSNCVNNILIMKNKTILISIIITFVIFAGLINLNYSKIAWLIFPDQYAKEVLTYPELRASIIKKDDKSYLNINSKNCSWATINNTEDLIFDEKTLSLIIPNYKIDTYYSSKPYIGKLDDKNLLIEIKDNKPIIQKFVCTKILFSGLESHRGSKETEVKLENNIIKITKIIN